MFLNVVYVFQRMTRKIITFENIIIMIEIFFPSKKYSSLRNSSKKKIMIFFLLTHLDKKKEIDFFFEGKYKQEKNKTKYHDFFI